MSIPKPTTPTGAYFETWGITAELRRKILETALSRGGEDCDLYFQHSAHTSVRLNDKKVRHAGTSVSLGMGVRVVVGDQQGYSYSEDLSPEALLRAARSAAEIAARKTHAPIRAESAVSLPEYYRATVPWDQVNMKQRVDIVRAWEQGAFALDSRVKRVSCSISDGASVIMIVRPDGRLIEDWRPATMAFVQSIVEEDGKMESNYYNVAARAGLEYYDEARKKRLYTESVERALFQLKAGKPPAGEMPVVLAAGPSAILLHEAIGHGMEADFNRKGTSIFSSLMNKKVASDQVTIIDDGTIESSRGAINIDDEGNESQRTVLVENGVLKSYLHDEISAKHFNVAPTGSGRRQSFRHAPIPRMRATIMENGPHTPEEIISTVKKGVYCVSFANGQVNIGGGDFAFYVKHGYLIEDGKLTQPIKDVNIIGNGPKALQDMNMVGNDMKIDEGGCTCGKEVQGVPVSQGMPTVLVSKLSVGGMG